MKKNNKNKRIRKSTKYVYIIIALILIVGAFSNIIANVFNEDRTDTKQIYYYTNSFNYEYDIKLEENKYISSVNKDDKNTAYVTELIDYTTINLNYEYAAQKETQLEYNHEVVGITKVFYNKDGEEQKIIEQEENLIENKSEKTTSDKIEIKEEINLDLKELNEFKQKMGMAINANYTIMLKINIETEVEGEQVTAKYAPVISIDLADKTTQILGENNRKDTQYVSKEYNQESTDIVTIIIDVLAILVAIYLLRYATIAQVTNRVKNEYKQELNKILKLCQDKIVKVSTKPDNTGTNIVQVKDFGEIVKLSEELFKPILYYFNQEKEEACFSVISNNVSYRFILKK